MIASIFTNAAAATLTQHASRLDSSLAKLTPDQIWTRASDSENSVGNIVLHLCGNLRQYTRHAVLGEADIRVRDDEFNARGGVEPAILRERLAAVAADAAAIIRGVSAERLAERIIVQEREMTVLEAIFKTTEHFSHHTGQIHYATKLLTHEALGYFTHKKASA